MSCLASNEGDGREGRAAARAASVLAMAVLAAACTSGAPAHDHVKGAASCAGPRLTISPTEVRAGETVQATGELFAADCYDTGQAGTPPALTGLQLQVTQAGRTWTVASDIAVTGSLFTFHVPIRLPVELRPGDAEVVVPGHVAPVKLLVSASAS